MRLLRESGRIHLLDLLPAFRIHGFTKLRHCELDAMVTRASTLCFGPEVASGEETTDQVTLIAARLRRYLLELYRKRPDSTSFGFWRQSWRVASDTALRVIGSSRSEPWSLG
jgi:hypothetical protein